MDAQSLHDYFDLLTDKLGSPYFSREEKDMFINMGQLEYIKRTLPSNEGGSVNFETTQIDYNNVSSLVYDITGLSMSSTGLVLFTAVQTKLNTASGSTEPYMYIINISSSDGNRSLPVKYTRQNDWFEFERNSLKKGTEDNPRYKTSSSSITISPINTSNTISLSLLKSPKDVNMENNTTSELPAHTHKTIVEIAVELASVSIRDQELAQLNSLQKNG